MLNILPAEGHEFAAAPFQTQVQLTKVAMTVSPPGLIADQVSPRVPTPFKFAYTKLTERDLLSIPDARASRQGRLGEVEFGATDDVDQTVDWGLICVVPDRDVREAQLQRANYDPLATASDALGTVMKLNREKRVADLVFNTASYPASHRVTLAGGAQWSHAESDPLANILDTMDKPLVRPNVLVIGQEAWTKLRRHPKIVEAVNMSGAGDQASGAASRKKVAELLELDDVLVGRAQYQTENPGQAEAYAYLWGKHAALLHVNRSLSGAMTATPSFTFTAEAMGMEVGTYVDAARGIGKGSTAVKISESCKELVAWNKAGYFWQNAVA